MAVSPTLLDLFLSLYVLSFSIPNQTYSPGREKKTIRRGLSFAPLGRKPPALPFAEPASPKITCTGQIKKQKKNCRPKKSPPRMSSLLTKLFQIKIRLGRSFKDSKCQATVAAVANDEVRIPQEPNKESTLLRRRNMGPLRHLEL